MARPLSQGESMPTLSLTGFYWLNLHRNTGHICKAQQSLSDSKDQTIDNTLRSMKAYLELGSDSYRAIKLWGTNSFHAWTLII